MMEYYSVVKYNGILKFLAILLNTNNYLVEKKTQKNYPIQKILQKIIKYIGISLTKWLTDLYSEKFMR